MFPIRDTIPSRRRPWVTWSLIGANVVVFAMTWRLPEPELIRVFMSCGFIPARWSDPAWASLQGLPALGPLPLFTSMFLHGGFFHLISNMWSLWVFGDNVEDRMGHGRFAVFYLVAGVVAAVAHGLVDLDSTIPTIGASGAIAGVFGAYLVLFPSARVLTLVPICFYPLFLDLPAFVFLGFWFVTQLLNGTMAVVGTTVGGVAWWAHIGGFVAGLVLFRVFLDRHWQAPTLAADRIPEIIVTRPDHKIP